MAQKSEELQLPAFLVASLRKAEAALKLLCPCFITLVTISPPPLSPKVLYTQQKENLEKNLHVSPYPLIPSLFSKMGMKEGNKSAKQISVGHSFCFVLPPQ